MNKEYKIYEVVAEMFECNENYPNMLGFRLHWSASLGFGELNFYYDMKKKEWEYDTECMSKEFCIAVLNKWLETIMCVQN